MIRALKYGKIEVPKREDETAWNLKKKRYEVNPFIKEI